MNRVSSHNGMFVRIRRYALTLAAALACAGVGADARAVPLGAAETFGVLGGALVTNTGNTTVDGDIGRYLGIAITGFFGTTEDDGPGTFTGTAHQGDALAIQAQADALNAYNVLAGLPATATLTGTDLGTLPALPPGVYFFSSSAQLTGTLVLDGMGLTDPQWVFQIGSTLNTAADSVVSLINGAEACDVFWQVGTAASMGERTDFIGTVIAGSEAISLTDQASVNGRLISLNAGVTLINNEITVSLCDDILVMPDITVTGLDGNDVEDDSIASIINGTDFGTIFTDEIIEQIFTITNTGTGVLDLGTLDITGDFFLVGLFPTSVAPGESELFTIGMDTSIEGIKIGTVTFEHNGPEGPFVFDLEGNVINRSDGGVVPEPATAGLIVSGLMALLVPLRRLGARSQRDARQAA